MTSSLTEPDADVSARGREPMLMYLIKQIELAVRSHLDELLRPDRLTALQYTALTVLERHPDMSVAQLARNSFVTGQSMADMIATLEERGLIERRRDQADRRRLAIALLPAGRELLNRYRDQVVTLEARMLHGITKPQITAMRRNLTTCHANLTADQPRLPRLRRHGLRRGPRCAGRRGSSHAASRPPAPAGPRARAQAGWLTRAAIRADKPGTSPCSRSSSH